VEDRLNVLRQQNRAKKKKKKAYLAFREPIAGNPHDVGSEEGLGRVIGSVYSQDSK
jgi:hypothetical protein